MGQQIRWAYIVAWRPNEPKPSFTLYRQSSAGHLFTWCSVPAPARDGVPTQDEVLEELYSGLLELMRETAEQG